MSPSTAHLDLARHIARALQQAGKRLVLVESCTGGNVAAALTAIPGISSVLCGSLVVYRNASKQQWLHISSSLLDDPNLGPVSAAVTMALAQNAMTATPEADWSCAVTGHIGPGAPALLDGQVFCVIQHRHQRPIVAHRRLTAPPPVDNQDLAGRSVRLHEATSWVLSELLANLVNADE